MARSPAGRQPLLDAARDELISSNGVMEISALKRRTGLSTGALYHHFGSKSGLLAAVYETFYAGLVHATADAHLPADGTWGARERERTRLFVAYHFADPLALVVLGGNALDPELTELEGLYIRTMAETAADNIRRGQNLGEIPADIDPDSTGAFVIGGLRHGISQQLGQQPPPTPDQATDLLWRLTARALGITGLTDSRGGRCESA